MASGYIELISKIKPKNNGTFAMVDASDVEMPNGKRLSEVEIGGGGGGNGSGCDCDPRLNDILDENGNILKEKLPIVELAQDVADMVLNEDGNISEDLLPEAWVKDIVDQYINEALGGEY